MDSSTPAAARRPRARSTLARWAPFAAAVAVHLLVLYAPDPASTPSGMLPGADKVVHVAVFAAVAATGLRAGLRAGWVVPALLGHAVVSELVQHLVLAERTADPWDVVADVAGVLLGWLVARGGGSRLSAGARRPSGPGR